MGQELSKKIDGDKSKFGAIEEEADFQDHGNSAVGVALSYKDVLEDDSALDPSLESKRYNKLLGMDFMKKAVSKQKEKSLEEAQSVLRQLRELDEDFDSETENKRQDKIPVDVINSAKQTISKLLESDSTSLILKPKRRRGEGGDAGGGEGSVRSGWACVEPIVEQVKTAETMALVSSNPWISGNGPPPLKECADTLLVSVGENSLNTSKHFKGVNVKGQLLGKRRSSEASTSMAAIENAETTNDHKPMKVQKKTLSAKASQV